MRRTREKKFVVVAFNDGMQFVSFLRDWEKMKWVTAVWSWSFAV
jgi:hypothetical protein